MISAFPGNTRSELARKGRLAVWSKGAAIGFAAWGLALLTVPMGELLESQYDVFAAWLPRSLMQLDLVDTIPEACLRAAFPIALGGWLLILDAGYYAALGAAIGVVVAEKERWRFGMRTLLALTGVVALLLGIGRRLLLG